MVLHPIQNFTGLGLHAHQLLLKVRFVRRGGCMLTQHLQELGTLIQSRPQLGPCRVCLLLLTAGLLGTALLFLLALQLPVFRCIQEKSFLFLIQIGVGQPALANHKGQILLYEGNRALHHFTEPGQRHIGLLAHTHQVTLAAETASRLHKQPAGAQGNSNAESQ